MKALLIIFAIFQVFIGLNLVNPLLLFIFRYFKNEKRYPLLKGGNYDYAIIVTAYQQTDMLSSVVASILKVNYENYIVYVVADNCDISGLSFPDNRVVLLRPAEILSNNIKSHLYAIENFKRNHEFLTIIDSDNLVDPNYFSSLNTV